MKHLKFRVAVADHKIAVQLFAGQRDYTLAHAGQLTLTRREWEVFQELLDPSGNHDHYSDFQWINENGDIIEVEHR